MLATASHAIIIAMLLALLLAGAFPAPDTHSDFSQSYRVWVSLDNRGCIYWLTDAGLSSRQLRDALKDHYDVTRGAEILIDAETPARCTTQARKAIRQAGFTHVRTRIGTDKDRMPGIP